MGEANPAGKTRPTPTDKAQLQPIYPCREIDYIRSARRDCYPFAAVFIHEAFRQQRANVRLPGRRFNLDEPVRFSLALGKIDIRLCAVTCEFDDFEIVDGISRFNQLRHPLNLYAYIARRISVMNEVAFSTALCGSPIRVTSALPMITPSAILATCCAVSALEIPKPTQ